MRPLKPAVLTSLLGALLALPATGQVPEGQVPDRERLEAVERELQAKTAASETLAAKAAAATQELDGLKAKAVAAAKEVQDQEHSLSTLEGRISELERQAAAMSTTLGDRDEQLEKLLMALERLALRPGDALTLSPLAPDDAVRTAILLRAALPEVRRAITKLQGELGQFYRLRADIIEQRQRVAADAAKLINKRRELDLLVADRGRVQEALLTESISAQRQVADLAREAADLKALFDTLAEEKTRREAREKKAPETLAPHQPASPAPSLSPLPPVKLIPPETGPVRSFAQARGTMPYPAAGTIASRYGEAEDDGLRSKGITIETRAGAQVVAPFDGLIVFAGPFRAYGELLIIEHSDGYHSLLAGMGRIDGAVGQRVFAGEPIGLMNDDKSPALYVELRREGQPINPIPWLAERVGNNSG